MELYLGLPSKIARSKRELFDTIRDRVWSRITGWNEKFLSQAGKEVLIKSVIQAISTYAMGCFKLPITLLNEIQGMVSKFWWSNKGNRKIHWLKWQKLCTSKLNGGVGFRQLSLFNKAMLAKQLWRLLKRPDSLLGKVLRARYFPHGDVFSAKLGFRPSFTWRSLLSAQHLFAAGCRWKVGSGSSIRIWSDPWIPRPRTFKPISPVRQPGGPRTVDELIDPISKDWDEAKVEESFLPIDRDVILSIPISLSGGEDSIIWHYSANGIFTVRSAYHLACELEDDATCSDRSDDHNWWRKLWQAPVPGKVKIFIWRACLNILPTSSNLNRRIPESSLACPHCADEEEDTFHALFLCHFARQVWGLSNLGTDMTHKRTQSLVTWLSHVAASIERKPFGLFLCLCWTLWWCRNSSLMKGNCLSPAQAVCYTIRYFEAFLKQNCEETVNRLPTSPPSWSAPPPGQVKINFDGAMLDNTLAMGIGIVARDDCGRVLAWYQRGLRKSLTVKWLKHGQLERPSNSLLDRGGHPSSLKEIVWS
ncbi:UNVERIFIED_CONTAM: putative mitochondrial protein [Sesamum latifolium]|uniref:Mitochondrial protein n=1 Tax=Sesamum latifolium TaxID=2727402 RepID=A0AAW2U3N7_9LAMI